MKTVAPVEDFNITLGVKYMSSNYFPNWYVWVECTFKPSKTELIGLWTEIYRNNLKFPSILIKQQIDIWGT